ncbi:MAG: hypothetical protein PHH77_05990 [Victivallaceae bacterium]|nr:hypothetical protein [Victivallaceae bacterium]
MVPHVKIVAPLLSGPDDDSAAEYKMTLKLHLGNDEVCDLDKYIKITGK